MARPKEFDHREVLDRATNLFWTRGYDATSIEDVVEATGINRGSIYGTFGDKQGLFNAVLEYYTQIVANSMLAELADPDPRRAIERMFAFIIDRTSNPKLPRGCLITNTSLGCRSRGDEISLHIEKCFGKVEDAIHAVMRRAQAAGLVASPREAKALGRFFFCIVQGLNVLNKAAVEPEALNDMARVAMSVWQNSRALPHRRAVAAR